MAKKKLPTTIGDVKDGDIVIVGEETYWLMIRSWDAYGCRMLLPDGQWSATYTWHKMDVGIRKVVKEANPSNTEGGGADVDPLISRG